MIHNYQCKTEQRTSMPTFLQQLVQLFLFVSVLCCCCSEVACFQPSLALATSSPTWRQTYSPRQQQQKPLAILMAANDPLLGEDYDQNQPPQQQRELSPTELILETERMDPATRAVVEAAAKKRAQESNLLGEVVEKKYPIDLPSPLLLASSMILAIVSTGSLFELIGGNSSTTTLPFAATAAVAALGTPIAIFLFYAAIAKATVETEEDDQRFLSGK